MLNRESNVFPGILGRTCDRPCEPACRRGRVDGKPVAICRLKRVAADNRGEVRHLLPTAPVQKNGKKIALIGAGPASLTVANDLVPLGYQVTIFEKLPRPGGLMRINIPAFRLPEEVLDEEIAYIVDMGVEVLLRHARREPQGAARSEGVRRGVRRQRRAERQGARDPRPPRHRSDLHRHRVARVDSFRARRLGGEARADHRRRQHGDGLLSIVEAARRDRREGHRAQDAQILQGVSLGARRRRGRAGRDSREPPAGPLHRRERRADRHGVREVQVDRDREGTEAGGDRARDHPVRHRGARDRAGQRVSVHRTRHRARVRQVGHARRRQDDVHVDAAGRVLRRRRGVRAGQHHLGRRARPSGGDLDPQLLSGRAASRTVRRRG